MRNKTKIFIETKDLPEDLLKITKEENGDTKVLLYRNPKEAEMPNADGTTRKGYLVEVAQRIFPMEMTKEAFSRQEQIDYYFAQAEAEDVKVMGELKIIRLKTLLAETDYRNDKYAEGALSEEDFAKHKAMRAAWRQAINDIEACKTIEQLEAIQYSESKELK